MLGQVGYVSGCVKLGERFFISRTANLFSANGVGSLPKLFLGNLGARTA